MILSLRIVRRFAPLALALPLAGCLASPDDEPVGAAVGAESEAACPDVVPAALTPAADETLAREYTGVGVQIYTCTANASGAAWVFTAPDAELLNGGGHVSGTHFAGPTWEASDGSSVVAAKVAGATVDATAIPWLLLRAVSHDGAGRFSDVTSVQRLETSGGLAPTTGCDASTVGAVARVPYTAQYFFYKAKEHGTVHQCGAAQD